MHPTRLTSFCLLSVALASAPATLAAQILRGGDLVTTNFGSQPTVFRVDGAGAVTTLLAGAPLVGPSGITVTAAGDVVVADFNASALLRIDGTTGAATTFATGLGGPLRVAEDFDGNFLVTAGGELKRVTPGGTVTTVASVPMTRPFGVTVDLDGNYLVADDLGRTIWLVTPSGSLAPIYSGPPLQLPQGVALFGNGDYAVIDGIVDAVFRIDRNTGQLSTWVTNAALGVNPEGIVSDWTGGFLLSNSQASGSGLLAIDEVANVVPIVSGAPFTNLESLALVPTLSGSATIATGPSTPAMFAIDAPAEAGRLYTLIMSASVYPGFQVPGDARTMPLNIDAFFGATLALDAPPFVVGWTGNLDNSGRATATLDLQFLPAGIFNGLVVYVQGITATSQATFGDAFSPLRLQFQ